MENCMQRHKTMLFLRCIHPAELLRCTNSVKISADEKFRAFVSNNYFRISFYFSSGFIPAGTINNIPGFDLDLYSGTIYNNEVYLGTNDHGLLISPLTQGKTTQVLPDGPIRNRPF